MTSRIGPPLDMVRRLYNEGKREQVLEMMTGYWADTPARSAEVAEACRLTRLMAIKKGDDVAKYLWEARAMATFALSGSLTGVAGMIVTRAYAVARLALKGEARFEDAIPVLDEMKPLLNAASESAIPEPPLMWRVYHEKRGYLLFAARRFHEALGSYGEALAFADGGGDDRGEIKVKGGQGLCLACLGQVGEAKRLTEALLSRAREKGYDIAETLAHNLQVLRSKDSGFTPGDFIPYEVI